MGLGWVREKRKNGWSHRYIDPSNMPSAAMGTPMDAERKIGRHTRRHKDLHQEASVSSNRVKAIRCEDPLNDPIRQRWEHDTKISLRSHNLEKTLERLLPTLITWTSQLEEMLRHESTALIKSRCQLSLFICYFPPTHPGFMDWNKLQFWSRAALPTTWIGRLFENTHQGSFGYDCPKDLWGMAALRADLASSFRVGISTVYTAGPYFVVFRELMCASKN